MLDRRPRNIEELRIDEECQTDIDLEALEDIMDDLDLLREQDKIRIEKAAIKEAKKSDRGGSKGKKKHTHKQGSFNKKLSKNKALSSMKNSLQVPNDESEQQDIELEGSCSHS